MQINDSFLNNEITWDPLNPLNIIGPHSSCIGLRCDYIFFPSINKTIWNRWFDKNKNNKYFAEEIETNVEPQLNSENNKFYEQYNFPLCTNNNNELDILKCYFIKRAKILFNKPYVIINSNYNSKHLSCYFFGVKTNNINFVTLSDHYAIQIDLQLKKNTII